jgi:hypothetical protein
MTGMWLFTTVGIFSIVQKRGGPVVLTVRARVRSDLDRLRDSFLPELGVTVDTPKADYAYRATVPHDAYARALGKLVADLHYDNFKDEVARKRGKAHAHACSNVWTALWEELPRIDAEERARR